MSEQLQAIATLLSLINPAICAMMFSEAIAGEPESRRLANATKVAFATAVILALAAVAGTRLLHLVGVSLDAFMVAGGGVLAWMGFEMLSRPPVDVDSGSTGSLTPVILFAASPGTITGVITIAAAHTGLRLPVTALVATVVSVFVMWLAIWGVARSKNERRGGGFLRETSTRFMGLIVLAMGVQFALTGYQQFTRVALPGP